MATLFPNELLVVEILEDVLPEEDIVKKTILLKEMGYRIALDDFIYKPEYEKLLDIADIIKIDFLASSKEEVEKSSMDFIKRGKTLLAEKVETREEYEFAKSLGFTLFQGYFFSKPEIVASKNLEPIRANYLQLLAEVNKKDVDFDSLAQIISMDLSLTYNLLKLVNSSAFGFRYKIQSVKHGVVALGQRQIKKWAYLVLLNTVGSKETKELTKISMIRGRFLEILALKSRYRRNSQELFLMGLLSLLDAILKRPLDEILDELKVIDKVREGLLKGRGEFGDLFKMILSYEDGQWDDFIEKAQDLRMNLEEVSESYMEAIIWYNKLQTERE